MSTVSGEESTHPMESGIAGTTYTVAGLTAGTTYYFIVRGIDATGESIASNEASATPTLPVPSAPYPLTATGGQQSVSLSWAASTLATSYTVYMSTISGEESTDPIASGITGTTYTAELTTGTTYFFIVRGIDATGESIASNEASATPTGAIASSPTIDASTGGNWKGVYGGDGYYVIGDTAPSNPSYPSYVTPPDVSGATTSLWNILSLPAYASPSQYQTYAGVDPTVLEPYALESAAPGSVNRLLGAWYSATSFTVSNLEVSRQVSSSVCSSGGEVLLNGFTLETATNVPVGSLVTMTSGADAGIQGMVASSSVLNGTYTLALTTSPLPSKSTSTGDTFTYGGAQVALYAYDWGSAGRSETISVQDATSGSTISSCTLPKGLGGANGEWVVWNISGRVNIVITNASGSPSCVLNGIFFGSSVPSTAPTSPINLSAIGADAQVSLSWTSSDPVGNEAKYNVYRATSQSGLVTATPLASDLQSTAYTDTDPTLQAGTTYYYAVTATNAFGNSAQSNTANAMPVSVPNAPTGLVVGQGPSSESITAPILYWIPAAGATSYNVYRSTTSGGEQTSQPYADGRSIRGDSTPVNLVWIDLNANNGTTYYYKVAGISSSGAVGPLSTEVSVTAGSSTPLTAANSFVTLGPEPGAATISWSAVPNASAYVICRYSPSEAGAAANYSYLPTEIGIVPANAGNSGPYCYSDPKVLSGTYTGLYNGQTYPTMGQESEYGVFAVTSQGLVLNLCFATGYAPPNTPPSTSGQIYPKYQILSVIYAPPGYGSTAQYSNSDMFGTSTINSTLDIDQNTVTTNVSTSGNIFGIFNSSTSQTYSDTWIQQQASSLTDAVSATTSWLAKYSGANSPTNGISHDADWITLWLNPVADYTIPASANVANPSSIIWTGYDYNLQDPEKTDGSGNIDMDVVSIPVGFLDGDYEAEGLTNPYVYELQRSWAASSPDGEGPGITSNDIADILAADPFTNPSYQIPIGTTTSADGRYTAVQAPAFPYYPPGNGGSETNQYTATYQGTITSSSTSTDTHTSNYSFQAGTSASTGGLKLFNITVNGSIQDNKTWTTTNSLNTTLTSQATDQAQMTIVNPSNTYPQDAPHSFAMYLDNVYGTFMFLPGEP